MVHRSFGRTSSLLASFNRSTYFDEIDRCAINFYGLPRSFFSMTLPSVIENILLPNVMNDCHVFVHYHYLTQETEGRSGRGGTVRPDDILLLEEAMRQVGQQVYGISYEPTIRFRNYTEEDFWQRTDPFSTRRGMRRIKKGIIGPARAVCQWSTQRFPLVDGHVHATKGFWGMHSERFLDVTLFHLIRNLGFEIREDPKISFMRVRADDNVWLADGTGTPMERLHQMETILNRKCAANPLTTQRNFGRNYRCPSSGNVTSV